MSKTSFPSHNVDPKRKKEREWCLQFLKAAWQDSETYMPSEVFYKASDRYDRTVMYMLGKQPTDDYKKALRVDEADDTSLFPLDFSIIKIVPNRINILLGKLEQREYNIHAYPIDALAKDELDKFFAEQKVKIMLRQQMEASNPELLQSPELMLEPGEPQDMEELEMEIEYGGKRKRSKEAEMAIKYAMLINKVPEAVRPEVLRDIVYHGWGIYKDDLGRDNMPKARRVDPRRFITNFCRRSDMSDMRFAGEVYEMTLEELEVAYNQKFSDEERETIVNNSRKLWGGPQSRIYDGPNTRNGDEQRVRVLDLAWFSTDTQYFEEGKNKFGNPYMVGAKFGSQGKNIKPRTVRNIYQGKWVIGTDICFEYGLLTGQKRSPNNLQDCLLPYHVHGVRVHEMLTYGFGESLIPLADAIQVAWMKIQNIRNQMIPNGFEIDLDALEDVAMGKGGRAMTKAEIIDNFFRTGILLNRRRDISERNVNYKSINFIENSFGQALSDAWNDFIQNVNVIREITGFNELTDSSTPNPKTLVPVAQMAYEATNNSLYGIMAADKNLYFSLAESLLIRIKQAIKLGGPIDKYIKSLGKGTIEHFRLSESMADRDYAVMLINIPTQEEKAALYERLGMEEKKGTITAADIIYVKSIDNLKQAEEVLAYRIKKREETMHKREMEKITSNHQGQQQSNIVAAQVEDENNAKQLERDMALEQLKSTLRMNENHAKAQDQILVEQAKPQKMGS